MVLELESPAKKVLIVTYYWPPSGGSGVQRWLKFVKYLPKAGWHPFVFTPENPAFEIRDESLLKDVPEEADVIRFPIWEPYNIFFKLSALFGKKRTAKPTDLVDARHRSAFQKIATWIRANLLIPDPRVFWVKPSVQFLEGFIKSNQIQYVITTGPPHSLHLIGLKLKKRVPDIRWVADFRDPWSEWGFLDSLNVGKNARKKHKTLESKVLSQADEVLTITPFYVRRFEALGKRKVHLLTNGYDDDDFATIEPVRPEKFLIRHVGIINERCDPRPLMKVIEKLIRDNEDFRSSVTLEFIGEVHPTFRQFVQSSGALNGVTTFTGNMPHKELMKIYGLSALLLLVLHGYKDAEGYMPGKLFEYLATGLPVLGVGPSGGDAAALLNETEAGKMIEADDKDGMAAFLLDQLRLWKNNIERASLSRNRKYSRAGLTVELTKILTQTD